jgi:hypothetical protein
MDWTTGVFVCVCVCVRCACCVFLNSFLLRSFVLFQMAGGGAGAVKVCSV